MTDQPKPYTVKTLGVAYANALDDYYLREGNFRDNPNAQTFIAYDRATRRLQILRNTVSNAVDLQEATFGSQYDEECDAFTESLLNRET